MIHYIKGNLFDSKAEALVNTVNTVGVMGKGIALQFRENFPENYRIYRNKCENDELHVGEILITEDTSQSTGRKLIVNFPTKKHWKYPSEYVYIEKGLKALHEEIKLRNIKSIAIPPLGSHNGGLDWEKVKPMIENALADLDCDIYLYEPSDVVLERMKSERVKLTRPRAMLLLLLADMNRHGEFASVFAAEKVIYFMQRFGAKDFFKIDFKPYYYGPYSGGKVAHVLYYLNGSYIKGMGSMDSKPFDYIWLTEDAESEATEFLKNCGEKKAIDICERTKKFLRYYYSNYGLELLSTVDYLLENTIALENWHSLDDKTVLAVLNDEVRKWSSRKKQLFTPELLRKALCYIRENPIDISV